ncbi:MAG TPA: tetratricopeptide repeat protein, partial [Ardenticatenaceae bacterium]|nr:tetratricopeptide repeat protein [Ardenticatenaceae bacterium]
VVIFLAIILLMRSRRQVERLVTIILVTSAPASLYGILQHFGRDPLPWGGDVTIRVSSVAGNPIFIAAYLIMIVPLTLVRVIENFGRLMEEPPEGESDRAYLAPSLLAGAYLFLLIIQLLVVFPYAQSRGPWLGMGAGLAFFGVVFALRRRLRWLTLSVAGAAVVGMLFLVVLNVPNSPLAPLRSIRYVDRLGSVLELETGTGKVRALIWEGVLDLLAANPMRNLVGYGPEAMYVAYNPHYPPDLAHYESRNASPDRSHNETFDSLVMTGVFGFAAQLVLFGSFFYFVLRWLGMINSGAQRNTFVALAGIGAVVGVLLPRILQGSFILSGVGLAAGMTTGLVIYLLAYAVTHLNQSGTPERPYSLLLIGLLSAVMAHFVEVHFGIAIGATRLYFWTYLALAVVVGIPLLQTEQAPVPAPAAAGTGAQRARRERRRAAERRAAFTPPAVATGTLLATSLMAGLLLIVMVFNYVSPSFSLSAKGYALVWLFVGVWAFGALAVVTQSAFESADQTRWLRRLAIYTGVTLSVVLLFVILYVPWVNWQPTATQITEVDLRNIAAHLANNVAFVYVFTFLTMIATALALLREEPVPVAFARQPGWQAVGYAVLALATIPIIVATNLNIARADISNKQAAAYEASRDWDPAIILYQEALQLQPNEDRYFLNLGRAYMEKARTLQDQPEQRDLYLQQALDVLQRARETNPLNTDHTRNLASLHRVWATLVDSDQERERLLDRADQYYAEAVTLSPHNAALWNDWAALHLDRGQYDQAREKLEQSLALDQQFPDTYMLLGSTYLEQEEWEKAVEAYDQALAIDPRAIQAYSGKAFAHSRLGQTEEAIAANQAAIEVAPNDFISHRNLALLYQQTGQLELALQEAEIALSLAGENDRPAIESFIAQIRQEMATAGG